MRTLWLGFVYYAIATPVGLLTRVARDPLARRWDAGAQTYWIASVQEAGR
jgi:hypothetical protein